MPTPANPNPPVLSPPELAALLDAGYDPFHPSLTALSSAPTPAPALALLRHTPHSLVFLAAASTSRATAPAPESDDDPDLVAVKLLRKRAAAAAAPAPPPPLSDSHHDLQLHLDTLRRIAEADHPHVVRLLDTLRAADDESVLLVTEFLPGPSVFEYLLRRTAATIPPHPLPPSSARSRHTRSTSSASSLSSTSSSGIPSHHHAYPPPLPEEHVLRIAKQLVWALACLYGRRVAHRQVSLRHLRFVRDPDDHDDHHTIRDSASTTTTTTTTTTTALAPPSLPPVKLTGFARVAQLPAHASHDERLVERCGEPAYASPEVAEGVPYDPQKADVWACGVAIYRMVAGRFPFEDKGGAAAAGYAQAARLIAGSQQDGPYFDAQVWANFSPNLQLLVKRMLKKEEAERPTFNMVLVSMEALLCDCAAAADGLGPPSGSTKRRRSSIRDVIKRGYSMSESSFQSRSSLGGGGRQSEDGRLITKENKNPKGWSGLTKQTRIGDIFLKALGRVSKTTT